MITTKTNTGCTPYQLARDLKLLLGHPATSYGDTILRAQVHPAMVIIEIEHRSVTKKGRREVTKLTVRTDVWTLEEGVWARTESLGIDAGESSTLNFSALSAQETRERDQWARLGGILDADGYRKPAKAA